MAADGVVPAKRKGCGFWLLVGFGVFVLFGVIGTITDPDGGESRRDAADSGTEGVAVVAPTEVSAMELFRAFQANELAAVAVYGDRPLLVSGTVTSVDLDFMDEPVVMLATDNEFMSAQLDFDDQDSTEISYLRVGQTVTALCLELSEVIGTPMLDDCTLQPSAD